MSSASRIVTIDQAMPGMVLAADVSAGGKVLLPSGTALSAAHLAGLLRREVGELVVMAPVERSAEELAALRAAQSERVARLFRRAGNDATMQALLRVVTEYRQERVA